MKIVNLPVNTESLAEYSVIPIHFEVKSRLSVELYDGGPNGIILHKEEVTTHYIKDYDALELDMEGEGPTRWAKKFNTSNWTLFFC